MKISILFNPFTAERHPSETAVVGFVYALLSAALTYYFFRDAARLGLVIFSAIPCIPLIYSVTRLEAKKSARVLTEKARLYAHRRAIDVFVWLFVGFLLGYLLLYTALPTETAQVLFGFQKDVLSTLPQGKFISPQEAFSPILMNNIRVSLYCLLFSFVLGSGALFIIAWNASVMAAAMGTAYQARMALGTNFVTAIASSMGPYLLHGIPEMAGYFFSALAGGLLYYAFVHDRWTREVVIDIVALVAVSFVVLIFAGLVEVFVTPVLF